MRIKKYYCRHCGQFRSCLQVHRIKRVSYVAPLEIVHKCKYCETDVIETEPEFKKWLKLQQEENK